MSKATFANLNGVVNNPQVSCYAAAEKEIEGRRLHSARMSTAQSKTNASDSGPEPKTSHLYITTA